MSRLGVKIVTFAPKPNQHDHDDDGGGGPILCHKPVVGKPKWEEQWLRWWWWWQQQQQNSQGRGDSTTSAAKAAIHVQWSRPMHPVVAGLGRHIGTTGTLLHGPATLARFCNCQEQY
jgi:hypothetical protein